MNYTAAASLNADNVLKGYMVKVITFDGESYTEYVEAYSEDEAQEIAAANVPNADYTMIQSCWCPCRNDGAGRWCHATSSRPEWCSRCGCKS